MKYDGTNFNDVITEHRIWLKSREMNRKSKGIGPADFSNTRLEDVTFYAIDLTYANFENTTINNVRFELCLILQSNFFHANINHVTFASCRMNQVAFNSAIFNNCLFENTIVNFCAFSNATLNETEFFSSKIRAGLFYNADISEIKVKKTNFEETDLTKAKKQPNIPMKCPETGSFIAYKIARSIKNGYPLLVTLEVPETAKRSSAFGNKCRCSEAKVISITLSDSLYGREFLFSKAVSMYDSNFVYTVGKTIKVDNFCDNRWIECAPGIHFFMEKEKALNYMF